jgi:hypothetical protein
MTANELGQTLKYDAWNRLVEIKQGSTLLASYTSTVGVCDCQLKANQKGEATKDLLPRGKVTQKTRTGTSHKLKERRKQREGGHARDYVQRGRSSSDSRGAV